MKINEVDPRNYDSDIDYYDAVRRAGRSAYQTDFEPPEKPEPYDAEDEIAQQRQRAAAKFRQKRETEWETKQEGTAPNGQKYNSRYIINAVDKLTADQEAHSFTDYHWGAKKLVDKEYGQDGNRVVLTLYIVDNHKYGLWRPWKDSPVYKEGVAEAEEDAFVSKLSGLKSWQVVIMNNYYRGKYSDYSGRYYYVLASSAEEARQVVLDNADAILQDLLSMKSVNGKKILPRGSAIAITDKRIGDIKDGTEAGRMTTAGFKRMFGPQGPMMVKLSGGAVVDVQGQEQGVAEGFKNTYNVGDRVDGPLGTGVIVAVSPHVSVDGRVKVKLDDPSRAGEDGKYKDTFVLDTTQLKHIADEKANPYAIGMAQAMKSTGDKPPLKKSTINKAHEIARAIKKEEK